MPVISVETGKLEEDQKQALIKNLTKTASETLNIPAQSFLVLIKEYGLDNVASGGKTLREMFEERSK